MEGVWRIGTFMALLLALLLPPVVPALHNAVDNTNAVDAKAMNWLDVAWLQSPAAQAGAAHSRVRRFVPFPDGSNVLVELELTVPVEGLADKAHLELNHHLTFNLPTASTSARHYTQAAADRTSLYTSMESFLDGFGYDGHACTLRTLCEIAESPFEEELYGEVINLILTSSRSPSDSADYDEYMLAEYYGQAYGNCEEIYPACPTSVLNIISKAF